MTRQMIFLSDLHYGSSPDTSDKELLADLQALVHHCLERRIRIHLLGDIFDYWMEYPDHHPRFADPVLELFEVYQQHSGYSPLYITGNHDNWTRRKLISSGFDLEHESRTLELDASLILLIHGDGLSQPKFRLSRPLKHRVLRHSLFTKFYQRVLSPPAGLTLMRWLSDRSRHKKDEGPERLNRWAVEYLGNSTHDFVICGHDHTPRVVRFPSGALINCGAFCRDRTAVLYTNGELRIVRWDNSSNAFTPTNHPTVPTG